MRRWHDTARKRVLLGALVCWLLVVAAMEFIPVPYVRLAPGPLFDVLSDVEGEPVIGIDGAPTYPTTGRLDLTTVSERGGPFGDLTLFEAYTGWLDPRVAVVPTDLMYPPDTTGDQAVEAGSALFNDSQEAARIAALREVGQAVSTHPWIVEVGPGSPAQGVLEHGDVVLAVDGEQVGTPARMARLVQRAGPDVPLRLDIRRADAERTVTVRTAANPDDPGKGYLGVSLGILADSPVTVDVDLEDVGGPSAGLVFSLGIVDKLTPGDLLDGRTVAGTGTIDIDGAVGPIGGIAQKMAAAHRGGAGIFLAPRANCPEIVASAPEGLQVVPVESLGQARDVLEGGLAAPVCPVG